MKRFLFIVFIQIFFTEGFSQNLVPNPGFEEVIGCPGATIFLKNTVGWHRIPNHYGSPDQYFGDCPYNGIKNPVAPNQKPYEGKGYAGSFCYGDNLREYMTIELIAPMIKDSVYFLEFYVLPAIGYGTIINSYGVHFSVIEPSGTSEKSLACVSLEEHIGNDTSRIIGDTVNWTSISGFYKARGGEKFATFGNFRTDKETKGKSIKSNCVRPDRSYMLIDGVNLKLKERKEVLVENKKEDTVDSILRQKAVFKTKEHNIEISLWDNQQVDGDIITLQLNDSVLLRNYRISKRKKKIKLNLTNGNYQLKLVAENLGKIPPNTCTFQIEDGINKKTFTLNSTMTLSEFIKIEIGD